MGQDDANVGGPGECPGHEFQVAGVVVAMGARQLVPGLGLEHACRLCGAPAYEPSNSER